MFWAPNWMPGRAAAASRAATSDTAGGKMIIDPAWRAGGWARYAAMNCRASAGPRFIFQFAASTGRGHGVDGITEPGSQKTVDDRHHDTSSSAATPGSVFPSRYSRDAPPPVDTWLIRDSSPACATAAAESPPPTIVVVPWSVAAAMARAMAMVPASNGGDSNTPMGPFQITVFAVAIARAYDSAVRGPMSYIASVAGIRSRGTACARAG